MATLAENPRRFPVVPEPFDLEVRQTLYRRTPTGAAYRLLFIVQDDTPDGPTVSVIHVRHAASRPITRREGREILTQNEMEAP